MTPNTHSAAARQPEIAPGPDMPPRLRSPHRYPLSPCGHPPGHPSRVDGPHNLVLEHLLAIRSDVASMRDDIREIKSRLSSVERSIGALYADKADLNDRYDGIVRRVERIERRLELTE